MPQCHERITILYLQACKYRTSVFKSVIVTSVSTYADQLKHFVLKSEYDCKLTDFAKLVTTSNFKNTRIHKFVNKFSQTTAAAIAQLVNCPGLTKEVQLN